MWLCSTQGIGAARAKALIKLFGSAKGVMSARPWAIEKLSGLPDAVKARLTHPDRRGEAKRLAEALHNMGGYFIPPDGFPPLLQHIGNPPAGLFVKGELPESGSLFVAMVGTRRASDYGREAAHKIAAALAKSGAVVVSGMARGIDSAAHRGALSEGGKTIAVLGCGLDVIYPPENSGLYGEITRSGAVVSEYPLGARPLGKNFPSRNRIIAGICHCVAVVEAGQKSGASITVDYALNYGREVFAVPGPIDAHQSKGTNALIKDGANMLTGHRDIISYLGIDRAAKIGHNLSCCGDEPHTASQASEAAPETYGLSDAETLILNCIGKTPISVDEVCERLGMPAHEALVSLTALELCGAVTGRPGGRFVRV